MSDPWPHVAATAIVSKNIRVRHPDKFVVGEHSIIDDFCYISAPVMIGAMCHIAAGCTIAGGSEGNAFRLGELSSVSSGVRIWCTSHDFRRGLVALLPSRTAGSMRTLISGDVIAERYTAIGANSVVMPATHIPEGTVIGALSYVPPDSKLQAWSVYAGVPVVRIGARDRAAVLRQVEEAEAWLRQHR